MNPRSYMLLIIAGLAVVAGTASAKTPTADAVVQMAVAAADPDSAMANEDMIRMSIRQEETTSDGSSETSQLTALIHGGALENTRVELSQGVSLVLTNKTGWALIGGQLDARPQTPRMAAGTIRQTLFPLLFPFSLQMQGAKLGVVAEGSFDGTPVWVVETRFETEFFAAPSMVTAWFVFIDRETNLVLGAEYLPTSEFRAINAEGIRYRYLKRQTVGGISFASQILLDGIDFSGAETGHVRVTKVTSTTAGPLDLSLFISPAERDRMDAGDVQ